MKPRKQASERPTHSANSLHIVMIVKYLKLRGSTVRLFSAPASSRSAGVVGGGVGVRRGCFKNFPMAGVCSRPLFAKERFHISAAVERKLNTSAFVPRLRPAAPARRSRPRPPRP